MEGFLMIAADPKIWRAYERSKLDIEKMHPKINSPLVEKSYYNSIRILLVYSIVNVFRKKFSLNSKECVDLETFLYGIINKFIDSFHLPQKGDKVRQERPLDHLLTEEESKRIEMDEYDSIQRSLRMKSIFDQFSPSTGTTPHVPFENDCAKIIFQLYFDLKNKNFIPEYVVDERNFFLKMYKGMKNAPIGMGARLDFASFRSHERLPYTNKIEFPRKDVHNGQMKLLLSEIELATRVFFGPKYKTTVTGLNSPKKFTHVCVYAGAAPSEHTGFLASLLPWVKFILIDPNPFRVRYSHSDQKPVYLDPKNHYMAFEKAITGNSQIYIIKDLFTLQSADACARYIHDCVFISDVRTDDSFGKEHPDTFDITWNMSQQYNWISIMRRNVTLDGKITGKITPAPCLLKFRHPFYTESKEKFETMVLQDPYKKDFDFSKVLGIDFVKNALEQKLYYFEGDILIQAFHPKSSTETRLFTLGEKLVLHPSKNLYEDTFFYYNNIIRTSVHCENKWSDRTIGFDHCADCSLTAHIFDRFLTAYDNRLGYGVKELFVEGFKSTGRSPKAKGHGEFF